MPSESEEFFICRINSGLEIQGLPHLTEREKQLLLTPAESTRDVALIMNEIAGKLDMTSDELVAELQPLIPKCVLALQAAFNPLSRTVDDPDIRDDQEMRAFVRNADRDNAMQWREHNRNIYQASRCQLSGGVQHWYLRGGGREQERQLSVARKCFVASTVFDGESHWVVSRLREFRDCVLLKHWWGRGLSAIYDVIGPTMAACVAWHPALRATVRRMLTALARRLTTSGSPR